MPAMDDAVRGKREIKRTSCWLAAWAAVAVLSVPLNAGPSPARDVNDLFTPAERGHWAFQKMAHSKPPNVEVADRVRNPIDAFVLAQLAAKALKPAPPADKVTLIRRATFDLTGLPPTLEEVDAFLADNSPKAFDKVVERLLASPRYGERWARHWLDLARYAESEGFKADEIRPNAWRYRDYVIKSFNDDKPYDRFIEEQIAGDELWPNEPALRAATAFNRHYPDESNARNLMQRRQEILNDITDTTTAVFLGLTVACARCHDHKYDPIRQSDYYRLQAFYANSGADDDIPLVSEKELKRYREQRANWEEKTRVVRQEMNAIAEPHRRAIIKDYLDKYPPEIQDALNKTPEERTPIEWQMVHKANQYLDPGSYQYIATESAVEGRLKGDQRERWMELKDELKKYASLKPADPPIGTGITDIAPVAPQTHVLRRGVYDAPKEEVQPGFLQILDPKPAGIVPPAASRSSGRRIALARILADPNNPLTARVMVNRIWQYHFGRGIVGTPSDFGAKGDRPTHPALLDWLASEFVRNGWSIKKMHRLIMTSNTYRQSSRYDELAGKTDPEDKLLWRFSRQRLAGEEIRDAALEVSGLLNLKMGGPSVFPELPPGMSPTYSGWKLTKDAAERNRRSIYVFVKRNTRYPLFESFDMPDTHESCPRRNVTTTPLQALNLLNSELTLNWAQGFAARVIKSAGGDLDKQIDSAYRLAFSRHPDNAEKETVKKFFDRQRGLIAERATAGGELALPPDLPENTDTVEAASLVDFCHMLINANEFVYRN
ncbi:MAG TPA: DUF1549 and DUF1553 domain-containing protein [Haliangiales bacterium]|nr:DUF1549 and DUF1553 domain-containing protein [Haliangiales bacterium]